MSRNGNVRTFKKNDIHAMSYYCLAYGASRSVMVSKIDLQTCKSEFESH